MVSAERIVKRWDTLKSQRGTWESHWQEIAERVLPRYSHTFQTPPGSMTKGAKKTQEQFDSTGMIGLERFAAAMESMLTPRNGKWHRLQSTDMSLNKDRETQLWFEDATNILFKERYAPAANYASQQHETYMGLGAFGTGGMFIDSGDNGGLRYSATNLSELIFDINHQGVVDTSYRKFRQTARQMKQRLDNGRYKSIPEAAIKALEKNPDKEFDIIHCIQPRAEVDVTRKDFKGMKYVSYYIAVDVKLIMSEGGFNRFPYAVSRYVTAPGEIYGRSPAMMVLPSLKVINEQKKAVLRQAHRQLDPVLLAHDDGVVDGFSLEAGSINFGGVNSQGQRLIHELPMGDIRIGQEMMDAERQTINDAFLVSLFQILVDSPQMTATEVLERAREKGALLSPTMGRQQSEMLGPMIERELDILTEQSILPPLPPALVEAEGEFDIVYDSPLTRSQRAEEAAGWTRTMQIAAEQASVTGDLSGMDHFNLDIIIPALAEINAVPPSWMSSAEEVAAKRDARAQQQQQQQLIDAAPAAAGLVKSVGGA